MKRRALLLAAVIAVFALTLGGASDTAAVAQTTPDPIAYRISLSEPEQRSMHVEVVVRGVGSSPVQMRMPRSSPGRYALHEFAKNVFDVKATDGAGRALTIARPNAHQWDVVGHDGTVRVTYRIFGDRTDGTYLGIDSSHAHINVPAALMYARGLDERPATVTLQSPPGKTWRVATQLFPTDDPLRFTAPNLQYLMDSPIEFGTFVLREFTLAGQATGEKEARIRVTVHHPGTDDEVTRFARDVETIVREERAIYGELAPFDGGTYTFLADYGPQASGDGMEHRNSTVLTSSRSLAVDRVDLLSTAAHEFFHSWNVERIRPKTLEPFNFDDTNMSGELWLAEGFTNYFESLVMTRTALDTLENTLGTWSLWLNAVVNGAGRQVNTAEDMSRLAPFVDAARSVDPTNWDNTFISYYTIGATIGLALDLSLRERTQGKVTADDYMRAMWVTFGKQGGRAPGYVGEPYTIDDARRVLGTVAGDRAFADEFFSKYIQGHEAADYERLLRRAGLVLRKRNAGRAWLGLTRIEFTSDGLRLQGPTPFNTPAYAAGLAQGDLVVSVDGTRVTSPEELQRVLGAQRPGARASVTLERDGQKLIKGVTLGEDPRLEIVTAEQAGVPLMPEQALFRKAWLSSRVTR
jgi:predicted metalloprotease with PDZ domain